MAYRYLRTLRLQCEMSLSISNRFICQNRDVKFLGQHAPAQQKSFIGVGCSTKSMPRSFAIQPFPLNAVLLPRWLLHTRTTGRSPNGFFLMAAHGGRRPSNAVNAEFSNLKFAVTILGQNAVRFLYVFCGIRPLAKSHRNRNMLMQGHPPAVHKAGGSVALPCIV